MASPRIIICRVFGLQLSALTLYGQVFICHLHFGIFTPIKNIINTPRLTCRQKNHLATNWQSRHEKSLTYLTLGDSICEMRNFIFQIFQDNVYKFMFLVLRDRKKNNPKIMIEKNVKVYKYQRLHISIRNRKADKRERHKILFIFYQLLIFYFS